MTTHICDFGKANAFLYNCDTEEVHVIKDTARILTLDLPGVMPGDTLVVEDAHLRSRELNSLAQYFDYPELQALAAMSRMKDVEIRLFPQKSTPKARDLLGLEKTDENDVVAIGKYLTTFPHIAYTLKHFKPKNLEQYRQKYQDRWQDRENLNLHLNVARNRNYANDGKDRVAAWIEEHKDDIYNMLNEAEKDYVGLKLIYEGKPREAVSSTRSNPQRLYTLVATLLNENGTLKVRTDNGKLPYWKYVKEVYFALTPYHEHGGIAASNYKYHVRRKLSKCVIPRGELTVDKVMEFNAGRTEVDNLMRGVWRKLRELVVTTGFTAGFEVL